MSQDNLAFGVVLRMLPQHKMATKLFHFFFIASIGIIFMACSRTNIHPILAKLGYHPPQPFQFPQHPAQEL
jgi:hypothetical protein